MVGRPRWVRKISNAPNSNAPECVAQMFPQRVRSQLLPTNPEFLGIQPSFVGGGRVNERVQQIKKTVASINGLLISGFIAQETRIQSEMFKTDLDNELHSLQSDVAVAS
jgi:hypothetical protein